MSSKFKYSITINGFPFTGFKTFTVSNSFDNPVHTATIEYLNYSPEDEDEIGKILEIKYGKNTIFKGYIFGIGKGYAESESTFSIKARALCADLFDSSIDKDPIFKKTSINTIITLASSKFQAFSSIKFGSSSYPAVSKDELEKALPEENAWGYILDIARKRKLILYNSPNNVLNVSSNVFALGVTHKLFMHTSTNNKNNIKSIEWEKDTENTFYKYGYVSEATAKGKGKQVDMYGSITDPAVRKTRINTSNIRIENNRALAVDKIKWKQAQLRANTLDLNLTVFDFCHPKTETLYQIGDYIEYEDDYLGISSKFLIASVSYEFGVDKSYTATLGLKNPEAMLPEPPDELTQSQEKRRIRRATKSKRTKSTAKGKAKTKATNATINYGKVSITQLRQKPVGGGL